MRWRGRWGGGRRVILRGAFFVGWVGRVEEEAGVRVWGGVVVLVVVVVGWFDGVECFGLGLSAGLDRRVGC